jgi:hypothetical protein
MTAEPVPFVDEIIRNLLARLMTDSAHVKLKTLNVVIALLEGGVCEYESASSRVVDIVVGAWVITEGRARGGGGRRWRGDADGWGFCAADEDQEADQPGIKCMTLPTMFSAPATAAAGVLREDSQRGLMVDTGSPRQAKAPTAGEAFALSVRSILLPLLKQHAEYTTTPHEKWGDRPQELVRVSGATAACPPAASLSLSLSLVSFSLSLSSSSSVFFFFFFFFFFFSFHGPNAVGRGGQWSGVCVRPRGGDFIHRCCARAQGAARAAVVRALGRRDEFSVEYQKQRRVPVKADDIVAPLSQEHGYRRSPPS